jgi:anti-sigma regulatory factor (Ser/Thr protein kinase)
MIALGERLTIRSDLSELERLFAFIDDFCAGAGVPNTIKYKLFLIIEELAVNVMTHGYGGRADGLIDIGLGYSAGQVEIRMEDEAVSFDPLQNAPAAVIDASVEDRPIGGLGVHLVKTLVSSIEYASANGRNRVRALVGEGA